MKGFKNSDGWNESPIKFNHLIEPLFSLLIKSKVTIEIILKAKPKQEIFIKPLVDNNEKVISAIIEKKVNK